MLDHSYAALARPAIDRAYVGLRIAGRSHVLAVLGDSRPSFILDFYFGLLARPMPADGHAAATIYRSPDLSGVERDQDGSWQLTEAGRDLALRVMHAIAAGAQELWSRKPLGTLPWAQPLPRLAELLGRLLDAGTATGGPAFHALSPPYEPEDASPALLVANRMGALRHHRADAHRAAWAAAGLTLDELTVLSLDDPQRHAVEQDTNRRDAPIYAVLSEQERLELLALLACLPG